MKTIGIIGGVSWFSTSIYYKKINESTNQQLGGSHSARILLHSIDFEEFKLLQEKNDWPQIEHMFTDIALQLQQAGADCLLIATNTVHLVADAISAKLRIPLLHIADETGKEITQRGLSKVGLLGTKFVMENAFFSDRLAGYGIETLLPDAFARDFIHNSIFTELTKGIFNQQTKAAYRIIIDQLKAKGAQAIIFGCTEIPLLINPDESSLPVFDTADIHAKAAVAFACRR